MAEVDEYIPEHYFGKRTPVVLDTGSETVVEQHHEETTNINKIIGRYRSGVPLPHAGEQMYADVSQVGELLDVKLQMSELQNNYENLPDFIKEKLPFADIGNVSDETLKEMISEHIKTDQKANEVNNPKASQEAGANNQGDASGGEPKEAPGSET